MKKVICVDEDVYTGITKDKEYSVINEMDNSYIIKNDRGNELDYSKRLFRPVPEAEFQYGQEVEVSSDGENWRKRIFIANNPKTKKPEIITVDNSGWVGTYSHIRPVQSMRDKVIAMIDPHTDLLNHEVAKLADRITC